MQWFLFSWGYVLPFYPPNSLKSENFGKMKKRLGMSSFYTNVPKIMIICYAVPEIWHVTNITFIFHFRLFFALLPHSPPPPNSPKIQNFKEMENTWRYHQFTLVYQKLWLHDVWFLRNGARRTDVKSDIRRCDLYT